MEVFFHTSAVSTSHEWLTPVQLTPKAALVRVYPKVHLDDRKSSHTSVVTVPPREKKSGKHTGLVHCDPSLLPGPKQASKSRGNSLVAASQLADKSSVGSQLLQLVANKGVAWRHSRPLLHRHRAKTADHGNHAESIRTQTTVWPYS